MSKYAWQIEEDFDRPGDHHMARDEALARERLQDASLPSVLRLYSWAPAAVSIGYQQRMDSIDRAACRAHGIDVVRRPTGGRAVLHRNELTYAIITRAAPADGLYAVHNRIAHALLLSLYSMPSRNDAAELLEVTPRSGNRNVVLPIACFASAARHEVTWNSKKVIGSAQRRFGEVVLQHGSILLTEDHQLLPELLAASEESRARMRTVLRNGTATLSQVFGRPVSISEAAGAIRHNFTANFFAKSELTPAHVE